MTETLQCPKCLTKFNSSDLKHERCPDCDRWLEAYNPAHPAAAETPKSKQRSKKKEAELEEAQVDDIDESEVEMADLVEAQDRTTYAVRSLALYLFISITSSTLGIALIYLVPAAAVPAALLIVVGFIASIAVGMSELSKSKP
jgi:uncharacterized membrane protein YdbT with pleckstrin-like domain